ncbi:hypothetical protein [Hafnia psychrotolerans]|uniref:Lipoprotein n=2 Tax=Hafnia psychrotolerans TaxID=1477018 RepID=A0ABQ1GJX1_9GAMM|nr:hypothetical protein GCM10011328_20250 [Hafnia psychrotolerans]
MRLRISLLVMILACAGCATNVPTTLTLSDPGHRSINNKTALTDIGTASLCAKNMLNASPADAAQDIAVKMSGSGDNITVDVNATLLDFGYWHSQLPISYRCIYSDGVLKSGSFTKGL